MHSRMTELTTLLEIRLLRGEHLTLHGPRGSGKSHLLRQLQARLRRSGIPCAYSPSATALDDLTRALERAYPGVNTLQVGRRTARARLWSAADQRAGVLLLDHFQCRGSATVSLLRRLHGRVAAVLTAVDVDSAKERSQLRPWRYGAMSVRMPLATPRQLRRLLAQRWDALRLAALDAGAARMLVEAARGRPGWIVQCAELACEQRYWRACGPLVTVLCVDTEAAVRYRALALLRSSSAGGAVGSAAAQGSSATAGGSAASGLITPKCAGR